MRRIVALCFAIALLLPAARAAAADTPAANPPNIVFILADDLGWTDLGCYGSKYYETPRIDRMAAEGMRFTSGYTCGPNCQPTRACLMSGQYGPRTGVYTVGSTDRFDTSRRPLTPVPNVVSLPLEKITVAEALKKAGYATGLFGKWHLGNNEFHPSRQGFDEAIVSMGKHFNFNTQPKVDVDPDVYLADFLTDHAVEFIDKHQREPFFLCLHHFAVHSPHEAKKDLIARFQDKPGVDGHKSPVYAAMIASLDESVGRVLAKLDELKLAENTLVVFTSDNGGVGGYEAAGVTGAGGITDNAPLRGGKGMLYEGGVRVPYIFRWPGKIEAGTVCDEPINSADLYPTLLELGGTKAQPDYPLDGTSYVACLTSGGKAKLDRDALYWHFPGYLGAGKDSWRTTPAGAIRAREYKLLEFFEDGHLELYDLKNDLGEKHDLIAEKPEIAKQLHDRLAAWRQEIGAPMPKRKPVSEATAAAEPQAERRPGPRPLLGYFGTYTRGLSKGIYSFRFDLSTGRIEAVELAAELTNPSFLAIHPTRPLVYAVGEMGDFAGKKTGAVSALRLDPATGALTLLNQQSSQGTGPCHVNLDRSARYALVANYGGGSIASLPILDDGKLGEAVSAIQHEGSSVNPQRQQGPHAHSIHADPANRFVFALDLGLDKIMAYRFDAGTGKLSANDPPWAATAPGAGPRHFAFHTSGRYAYAINELDSTVTAFAYDAQRGALETLQSVSTLPEGFDGKSTTAEVQVHPSGKFLYGSNRGHDSIALFTIDQASGKLTPAGHTPTGGKTPRNFAVDPTGRWLLAANQDSDNVTVFRINQEDGSLEPTGQSVEVGAPVCVKFVLLPRRRQAGQAAAQRPQTVPVNVTVTLDGQPVEGARVLLSPANQRRAAAGVTDATGRAALTTFVKDDGAVPGTYRVGISKQEGDKHLLPARYSTPEVSGLTVEIVAGGPNQFAFELRSR